MKTTTRLRNNIVTFVISMIMIVIIALTVEIFNGVAYATEKEEKVPILGSGVEVSDLLQVKVDKKIKKKKVKIKCKTIIKKDNRLPEGKSYVQRKGKKGVAIQIKEFQYVNGELRNTRIVSTQVKKKPVARILVKGSAKIKKTNRGSGSRPLIYVCEATAYTQGDPSVGSITASGRKAKVGHVAVDPKLIPLGTKLYIESMDNTKTYGFAIAADTGGAIKGKRIDLYYNTHRECVNFGRRNVRVYVLK